MNKQDLIPIFLSVVLTTGCASNQVRHVDNIIPPTPENDCWSNIETVAVKGEGEKEEIVTRKITNRFYSNECGDRKVEQEIIRANAEIQRARINAASAFLTQIVSTTRDQKLLSEAFRRIAERLDSRDGAIRASQYEAMIKAGLNEDVVRTYEVKCKSETKLNGVMALICN